MATKISDALQALSDELRFEPTTKRIRAMLGDDVVLDSRGAVALWEPGRVVPCYAAPANDVVGVLSPATPAQPWPDMPTVLHPGIPFSRHSSPGTALDVSAGGQSAAGAAFELDDPDLTGYVAFDPAAFNWLEENDAVQSHPRDPFHRVDIRHSARHVRVTAEGVALAESSNPVMVFETALAERIYLPPNDVDWDQLIPTDSVTLCPYKGSASYWRLAGGSGEDVAWSYREPLPLAAEIAGLVCFYDNRVDVREL
ncbi:hypothetical protein CVV68_08575 [Arthrobacter livingstonensis]|uniref:DUF427 domain-containing protein n=1 Tax=Arthrobacter livingstonensis TaxID=670078 RepID=A0A2V5L8R9_9MICC|nr:DUF427 domain-containing protein [Arthrobacter livingstonensis]PYI67905.1 hypothetical protein CVV68_08575 [Arthrobacter livingstonensis]